MAKKYGTASALRLLDARTTKAIPLPKASVARVKKAREKGISGLELLNLLWDADPDLISGSGEHIDTFIGPNKIHRKGIWDIWGAGEGIEYEAIITLKRLIPAKKSAENAA